MISSFLSEFGFSEDQTTLIVEHYTNSKSAIRNQLSNTGQLFMFKRNKSRIKYIEI